MITQVLLLTLSRQSTIPPVSKTAADNETNDTSDISVMTEISDIINT